MDKIIFQSAGVSKFGLEIQVGRLKKRFSDAVQGFIAVGVDDFLVFTDENIILFGSQQPNQPIANGIFFSDTVLVENNVVNGFIGVLKLPSVLNVDVIAVSSKNNQAQARNDDNQECHHDWNDKNSHMRENQSVFYRHVITPE